MVGVGEGMKRSRSKNCDLEQTEAYVRSPWKGFSTVSQVFFTSVVGCGWSSKGPAYVNLGIEMVHGKCKLIWDTA